MVKRIIAWWQAQRRRKQEREQLLALWVLHTSTMPGVPPPSERVQRFVNRTLKRRVF